jgi:hypothetical protein
MGAEVNGGTETAKKNPKYGRNRTEKKTAETIKRR